ncbi:MAG: hypothetical protein COU69_00090 [Candidatus Pacebacteria bacterium CG10_big_fil_rev_8_21_14_0_10_56_10]|nr:MAG: hypothetical protein COU69_00090 [Candidatus Pacebacteria bacterium CG10_big_fil_rev_8_21_14_0_10_56_10]
MTVLALIVAAAVSGLVAPLVIKWYRAQGWIDDPLDRRHPKTTHLAAVPRGGGVVVFLGLLVTSLLFLEFDRSLLHILAGAGLLTVVGWLDDVYDIHPKWRLLAGLAAGLIVVGAGIGIAYVTNPLGPGVIHLDQPRATLELLGETRQIWLLSNLFALLFIVWNMNIINWASGLDGQMPGLVVVAAVFIGILSYRFIDDPTQFNTATFSFMVAGAYLGLLAWNWYPQKMMPGYGGGSLAGYLLAVLAIISGAKVATVFMVLAVPTADAAFTVTRRLLAGKSPLWGDRGHLHHKLLDVWGWSKRQIAVFYWLTAAVMGLLSLGLSTWGKILTVVLAMGLVFAILIASKLKQLKTGSA